jgi:uncharacterized protein DUF1688
MTDDKAAALSLLNAAAVRARAKRMLALGLDDKLPHFRVEIDRLDDAVERVVAATRKNYPTLDVPFHSRWRHFTMAGRNRAEPILQAAGAPGSPTRGRAAFDLAIVSVLVDAGAGAQWRYHDAFSGEDLGRSEGLALASLDMFARGVFSAAANNPLRADATALARLDGGALGKGFQVASNNQLLGLDGRATLLRELGKLAQARPETFALQDSPRPGGFFDYLAAKAEDKIIPAPLILSELLQQFGPIWPSRLTLGGMPLGDCWRHPALVVDDATSGLVPLHKLSQWLAYSLIEPLQQAGFTVTDIDGLTGLAEYRNGGLFVDTGALALRDQSEAARAHEVDAPLVVEWRALTVALLDRLALAVRAKLNMNAAALPLAKVLQGGSWAAGRELAFARRPDGSPPIKVLSDGTVF